jgi:predicted nucleic acid-binding Zn ribbon protein
MEARTRSIGDGAPEALGPILAQYLKDSGLLRPQTVRRLAEAWGVAAGTETAAHTRLVGFRKNVLEVEVDSAARLHELANFGKPGLLARLAAALPTCHVQDIRFRPGRGAEWTVK